MTNNLALPRLIDRASKALLAARSSAEVLEAGRQADVAYSAAKMAGRMAKQTKAHDTVIAAARRAQADALEIEAGAKRRLADEYDSAQQRGEVAKAGNPNYSATEQLPGPKDVGLTAKLMHDARAIRDAERGDPGIVKRTLDGLIAEGKEPTKAELRKATRKTATKPPVDDVAGSVLTPQVNDRVGEFGDFVFPWCHKLEKWAIKNKTQIAKDDESRECLTHFLHIAADELLRLALLIDGRSINEMKTEQEREEAEQERDHAEYVREETQRRADRNAPLLAPMTPEKEQEYTRLIKSRELYEGACDLSWQEYFAYRGQHPDCAPLSRDELDYANMWTAWTPNNTTRIAT
jgi:hypothetical protein